LFVNKTDYAQRPALFGATLLIFFNIIGFAAYFVGVAFSFNRVSGSAPSWFCRILWVLKMNFFFLFFSFSIFFIFEFLF